MKRVLKRNTIINLKDKKIVLSRSEIIKKGKQGIFVLDMEKQSSISELDIFPAELIYCDTYQLEYEVRNYYVILGRIEDICLE